MYRQRSQSVVPSKYITIFSNLTKKDSIPKNWRRDERRMSLPLNIEQLERHNDHLSQQEQYERTTNFMTRRKTLQENEAMWWKN